MGYIYSEETKELVEAVRDFCNKEVKEQCREYDRTGEWPKEIYAQAKEMQLHMLEIPEAYGGLGLDEVSVAAIIEEMAQADAGFALTFAVSNLAVKGTLKFGNEAQKKKVFEKIIAGDFGAFALTEPQAGSDASNVKTTARREGDSYVLNGRKCFITNGGVAGIYLIMALTDKTKGLKGMSAFIVEAGTPGLSTGKHEDKMGIRTSNTTDVVFDSVRVPAENMIGAEGSGFKTLMKMLSRTRPTGVAPAVGVAQRALDLAIDYSRTRLSFGQPIGKLEGIQFKLADMEAKIQACQAQLAYSAALVDKGIYDTLNGSSTKLFVSEAVLDITLQAQQVYGGYGYSKEYPLEKLVRDARIFSIYEGSSEIQRYIIGKTLVGKI